MQQFLYEATNPRTGQTERGTIATPTAQDAEIRLSERGLRAVRVQIEKPAPGLNHKVTKSTKTGESFERSSFSLRPLWFNPVSPADRATFFRQLASLLHAGFTPLSALADLAPRTANKRLSRAASAIGIAAGRGEPLAQAFAAHPDVFPAHVAGLIGAGEVGGFLEYACEEAALGAEGDAALRQGLWLPKLLFWQAAWSVWILQPLAGNIAAIFETGLPGVVLALREFAFLWLPIGLALHILCEVAGFLWRQPALAADRDRLALVIPVMRRLAHTRAVAGFTRLLRRLLLAGVSPESSFTAATNAVPNSVYRSKFAQGIPVLRAGNGLDAAIEATGMLEHDPLQLLVTGQRTGQWTEMLDQVTATYQDQAATATERAKNAQKRLGILVTALSIGYVTIVCVAAPLKAVMQLFGGE